MIGFVCCEFVTGSGWYVLDLTSRSFLFFSLSPFSFFSAFEGHFSIAAHLSYALAVRDGRTHSGFCLSHA